MYSNPRPTTQHYQAYAAAARTVGKTRQVVMLYDGSIRFVKQAIEAIRREDYETRYNLLAKVSEIVSGLQNSLDFEGGGDIARLLYDYYASIDARIFSVHRTNNVKLLESVIKELQMMRDAWHEIDQASGEETQKRAHDAAPVKAHAEYSGLGVSA